jgi:hypothetical protein
MNAKAADNTQKLEKMLKMIANTQENECDCDHVDELMEEAAELMAQGIDIGSIMPEVKQHLEICDCCHMELKALLAILETAEA